MRQPPILPAAMQAYIDSECERIQIAMRSGTTWEPLCPDLSKALIILRMELEHLDALVKATQDYLSDGS